MPRTGTSRPSSRRVFRDAARMYRGHFGVIVGTAAAVLLPFAIADALGLLDSVTDQDHPVAVATNAIYGLFTTGLSGLAVIFYAGMLDHVAAAWHRGEAVPDRREVARRLPWRALVLATLLGYVLVVGGLVLFIVPGIVIAILTSLSGPVIVAEGLGPVAGLRRSAVLVSRNAGLVIVTVAVPFVVESALPDAAADLLGHSVTVELVAETLVTLLLASFVGVLEVVTAHALRVAEADG
ncbi:MAG: hypothetical protein ACXVJ7_07005 [Acidimicrobiia bacterium]